MSIDDIVKKALADMNNANETVALKAKVEALEKEIQVLKTRVNYWKIESDCNEARWIRTLEQLDEIRFNGQK